ncbi:MAG: shikimate kinase [Deltaproteobacteria bacterium]|nr:shikimate kinase [Deltaproteobacteria bacterium]
MNPVKAPPHAPQAGEPHPSGATIDAVWLVGMMGSGKTSVGRRLAARLGRRFVDTDQETERAAGVSVRQIFAREGEAGFRARERAAIEAVAGSGAVVSLGGGAVAQPGVAERLAATGTVVYLRARPETLLHRVGEARTRPLLREVPKAQRLTKLRSLLEERRHHYERAGIVVDTDDADVEAVVAEIVRRLGGQGREGS